MRLLPASYVASVRGAAHAAVRKAMLTPDALYYASDIKPAAYCNENPGGPCIVVCTIQRNAALCASRQPAVQHLNNPENLSKRPRPPLFTEKEQLPERLHARWKNDLDWNPAGSMTIRTAEDRWAQTSATSTNTFQHLEAILEVYGAPLFVDLSSAQLDLLCNRS